MLAVRADEFVARGGVTIDGADVREAPSSPHRQCLRRGVSVGQHCREGAKSASR